VPLSSLSPNLNPQPLIRKLVTWQRQGGALLLILVGVVSIVVCTRATVLAVHEEAQVVQVAKDLVSATQVLQHAQATEEQVQKLASSVTAVDEVTRKFATLKARRSAPAQ